MSNFKQPARGCQHHPDNTPPTAERIDPWLCHVCGDGFRSERGKACAICYQIACREHLDFIVVENRDFQQPQLKPVCSVCRQLIELEQHDRPE